MHRRYRWHSPSVPPPLYWTWWKQMKSSFSHLLNLLTMSGQSFFGRVVPARSLSHLSLGILHKLVLTALFSWVLSFLPDVSPFPTLFFHLSVPSTTTMMRSFVSTEYRFLFIALKTSSFLLNRLTIRYHAITIIDYFLDHSPWVRLVFSSTGWPSLCLPSLPPLTSSPTPSLTSLFRALLPTKSPLLDDFFLIFFPFSKLCQHVGFVVLSLAPDSTYLWSIFKLPHLCESCLPLIR